MKQLTAYPNAQQPLSASLLPNGCTAGVWRPDDGTSETEGRTDILVSLSFVFSAGQWENAGEDRQNNPPYRIVSDGRRDKRKKTKEKDRQE
jgi:hypothetical protein